MRFSIQFLLVSGHQIRRWTGKQKLYENVLDLVLGTLYITWYFNHQHQLLEFQGAPLQTLVAPSRQFSCQHWLRHLLIWENCKTYVSMFLGHKILLAIDPIQRLQAWELFLLDFPFYATHPPHKLLVLQLGFWTNSGHPTFPGMFTFSQPRHFSSIFADFNVLVARLFLQSNSQIFWIVNISYAKFLRNLFIYLKSFNRKTFKSKPPVTCISRLCTVLNSFVWNDLRKDEFYTLKLWYIRNDATFSESLCKVCMYIKSENKHFVFLQETKFSSLIYVLIYAILYLSWSGNRFKVIICPSRLSSIYIHFIYVYSYFNIQRTEKYSIAMC